MWCQYKVACARKFSLMGHPPLDSKAKVAHALTEFVDDIGIPDSLLSDVATPTVVCFAEDVTVAKLSSDFESEALSRIVDLLDPGSEVLWHGINKLFASR